MKDKPFFNRELSWLEFNHRVLDEARDASNPLLERLKFLAITASNLDEFYMVRVGGLQMLVEQGVRRRDPAGLSPAQQLRAIAQRVRAMVDEQTECYLDDIEPRLREAGIRRLPLEALSERQRAHVEDFFETVAYPVMTPMLAEDDPLPLLANRGLHLALRVRADEAPDGPLTRVVFIPLGASLSRFVRLPGESVYDYAMLEDVVAGHADQFFPGETVLECAVFRLTRNADVSVSEDQAADLIAGMEEVLTARKRSDCVRLEVQAGATKTLRDFLQRRLDVDDERTFDIRSPLDLSAFMELTGLSGYSALREAPWPPQPVPRVEPQVRMFDTIADGDMLLFHPQQSFEPVVRFVEEAAADPDVLAIKQILYRTSRRSPVIAALARAAEQGKYVTAIVELKARFDEERNIEWARALEEAGVQVIYGIRGLKTHAKLCIVVRREAHGLRRYLHFGTGNYNEVTARLYTDTSLLTADPDLGADASMFFNTITGLSQPQRYRKLQQAPLGLRRAVLDLIAAETDRCRQGQKAIIMAKMNALVDPEIIQALYEAGQAGVSIKLSVRGTCCLKPGVPTLSDNITVTSIIDRYLEHDRILYFYHGGEERMFISSADWMPRNLDRRIELLVPVESPACRGLLLRLLEARFADTAKARVLLPDGRYGRVTPPKGATGVRSQETIFQTACELAREARSAKPTTFEPHRAPENV